jgi:ATP-dependent RNA helicase DHX8/PRP22
LDVLSCGRQTGLVQKAICSGFFRNAAKRDPQEGKISIKLNIIFYKSI